MEKSIVGSKKILKKEQVLISVFLIAILVMSSGSLVAFAKSNTYVVKPNGVDDTADIQAAFNACGSTPGCTVQLVAGTYYVGQIAVLGFQGRFVGMGQGATNIQALPNLPSPNLAYDTDTVPFWAALPTPASVSGANPWPALFTFVNGAFVISGMTISEPYTATTCTTATPCPTLGWDDAVEQGSNPDTALLAAIVITGETQSVTIDHLTVIATPANLVAAIFDIGLLLPENWQKCVTGSPCALTDRIPLTGTFWLTNSLIIDNNPAIENVLNAVVTISHNTVEGNYAVVYLDDVSNSRITITGNKGIDISYFTAVFAAQSVWIPGLLPSTVYVTDNDFQVSEGANGVFIVDYGTPSTLSAVVTGNTIVTDTSCGCYTPEVPAIGADYADNLSSSSSLFIVSQNNILGGGSGVAFTGGPNTVLSDNRITGVMAGVVLGCYTVPGNCYSVLGFYTSANGAHVIGNVIKNSAQYGIWVGAASSHNKIVGNFITGTTPPPGGYDLYWDQTGTGNVWFGNFCGDHSSSPLGLC